MTWLTSRTRTPESGREELDVFALLAMGVLTKKMSIGKVRILSTKYNNSSTTKHRLAAMALRDERDRSASGQPQRNIEADLHSGNRIQFS